MCAVLEWERCFPDRKLDKDSPQDMQWIFERYVHDVLMYSGSGL
jgi:hypothetical protein